MASFDESLSMKMLADASPYASALFRESFALDFPVPRVIAYGDVVAQPSDWRQAVSLYAWPDGRVECVGFANWIKYKDAYLGGALCVKRDFYRRLPRAHYEACKARGGIGQMLGAFCDGELADCVAWFGYCGDPKAFRVDLRIGFEPTDRPFILAKWIAPMSEAEKRARVDEIATLGPF